MDKTESAIKAQRVTTDLLPNEREISYESIFGFLIRNKTWILGFSLVIILAGAGWLAWQFQENKMREQAGAKLAAARSLEALQAVAEKYPGTDAALLATMNVADLYFQKDQWDQAAARYQEIVERHPESPLLPSALMGQATILEVKGRVDEALKVYRTIASMHGGSFQAPQAQFAAARLLETTDRLQEARKAYEDLITDHSQSAWKHEAEIRLQKVNLLLKSNPQKPGN